MIKFPTDYGVGELRENQMAARECFVAIMEMDDHLQAMNIEEHRMATELVEKVEEILLDNSKLNLTTKIRTCANPVVHQLFSEIIGAYSHGAMKTCQG